MHPRCQLLSGRMPAQGVAFRAAQSTQRAYATSAPTPLVKNPIQRRRGGDLGSHLPKHVIPTDSYIPEYPHGEHALFKQANKGLYGEQMIRFGNNVSEETETKTRRNWKPNTLSKSVYSVALKKKIKLRVTAKVLKTMDREGGLDEYLLKDNPHRIKELGPMGWQLRWTLMQKPEVIARLRADAVALGIDQATIDKQWPIPKSLTKQEIADEQELAAEQELAQALLKYNPATANPEGLRGEYEEAMEVAEMYLQRGTVEDTEQGIKLAFIRRPLERVRRIGRGMDEDDLQATQAATMLERAEAASTNTTWDPNRRAYLITATTKADLAIRARAAGGVDDYVTACEQHVGETSPGSSGLNEIARQARRGSEAGEDAWGALVDSSNRVADKEDRR